jgi:ABC-2 type transport system ATP-binding protein
VERVEVKDGELRVTLAEDVTEHASLIARLVAAGHGIVEVREEEIDLETAFLRLTRGALAKPATD